MQNVRRSAKTVGYPINRIFLLIYLLSSSVVFATDADDERHLKPENRPGEVAAQMHQIPTQIVVSGAKVPTTPFELLKNVKIVMDQHLLQREDFYTEANLRKVLGGTNIVLGGSFGTQKYADIRGYDTIVQPLKLWPDKPNVIPGLLVRLWRTQQADGAITGELSLSVRRSGIFPDYETVEGLFKSNREVQFGNPYIHERIEHPTSPHGNDRVEYKGTDGPFQQSIRLGFAADGTLSELAYDDLQ